MPYPEAVEMQARELRGCWTCRMNCWCEISHSSQDDGGTLFRCANCKAIYPIAALNTRPDTDCLQASEPVDSEGRSTSPVSVAPGASVSEQSRVEEVERLNVALAIERADNQRVPDGYADGATGQPAIDHDEVSDWGAYLADAALAALPVQARPDSGEVPSFEREERYLVIKRKHLKPDAEKAIRRISAEYGGGLVECVVIESDWPEYEPVWRMIERRMNGEPASLPTSGADTSPLSMGEVSRYHVEGETSTVGPRWRVWGRKECRAIMRGFTDQGLAQAVADKLNELAALSQDRGGQG